LARPVDATASLPEEEPTANQLGADEQQRQGH
jgi:hypothetical protein